MSVLDAVYMYSDCYLLSFRIFSPYFLSFFFLGLEKKRKIGKNEATLLLLLFCLLRVVVPVQEELQDNNAIGKGGNQEGAQDEHIVDFGQSGENSGNIAEKV
eukprot:m.101777 g.101777  ORF g.101777 m.101777 type:complete len:102 (+) comp22305_c1_seq2:318-623(+)